MRIPYTRVLHIITIPMSTYTIPRGGWTRAHISLVVDDLIDEFMGGLSKRHNILYGT